MRSSRSPRAAITLAVVTAVALVAGMRITGDGVDVFGLYGLAALLVLVGYGWAAGVAFRFRTIQAGPLMQTPVFLILFLAPVYVPLGAAEGLDPRCRERQPGDRLPRRRPWPDLRACTNTRGSPSPVRGGLILVFAVWTLTGLRNAERST